MKLSAAQLRINQKISQAAVRRANAIDRWLEGGIEGRDICGGALGVNAFDQSVTFGRGDAAEIPAADPRPVQTGPAGSGGGGGKVTLTAKQLRINQRVSQAAVRRANALEARLDAGLTGGDVKDGSISLPDLVPGVSIQNAGSPAEQPAPTTTDVPKPKGGGSGKVTLSAAQLRVNQKIAQAAVRRTNTLINRLEGGLTAEDFKPGTLTGADIAK